MSIRPPARGEIWEHTRGSHQYRILIISNDEYNELPGAIPWAVTVERGGAEIPGYVIALRDEDPVPGAVVVIPHVLRCDPAALRRCLGEVSAATLAAVARGLSEFLDLGAG